MRKFFGILAVVIGLWALFAVFNNSKTGERQAGKQASQEGATQDKIATWPQSSRALADRLISKYGEPSEIADDKIVWNDAKPWKRTTLYRDGGQAPLEQVAAHPVPEDKAKELERVKGEVWAGLGKDEISARGSSEEMNFIAVNLAHEVLVGEKTVEAAQAAFGREKAFASAGRSSQYREGLLFDKDGKSTSEVKREK